MMQAGTVANFVHKYGSFRGFLDHYRLDVLSVQVLPCACTPHVAPRHHRCLAVDRRSVRTSAPLDRSREVGEALDPTQTHLGSTMPLSSHGAGHPSQEHKLTEPKLTRDLVCVDGFEVSSIT